jgi:mRNA interferase MazF
MTKKTNLKRGEVYWVSLDPAIGSETKKKRPGVIISNDAQNMVGQRVIIAPITSVIKKVYPFEVLIITSNTNSKVMLDQIRTIDCQRLGDKMGKLTPKEISEIDKGLKLVLAIG